MQDMRNVIDEFKGRSEAEIVNELDAKDHGLVIALENTERDFNMGTIVRSANAFGVRQIYVIGRRQWNKRGAMMTDKYLHVHYVGSTAEFVELMRSENREIRQVFRPAFRHRKNPSADQADGRFIYGSAVFQTAFSICRPRCASCGAVFLKLHIVLSE